MSLFLPVLTFSKFLLYHKYPVLFQELYKQAIAMRTTIFGLDHQAVASTYNNYGGLMVLTKEFDTARDLFESALKIKIKVDFFRFSRSVSFEDV